MSDFDQVMRQRRSIRRFSAEPVGDAELAALVEAAALAPSAGNRQDWRCRALRDRERIRAAAAAVDQAWAALAAASGGIGEDIRAYAGNFSWFAEAPLLLAFSARPPPAWLRSTAGPAAARIAGSEASAMMAVQNLLLAASSRGLGACVLTAPVAAEAALRGILGLERRRELLCLVAIGHPDESPPSLRRHPPAELLEKP